jgi:hypothetical protein
MDTKDEEKEFTEEQARQTREQIVELARLARDQGKPELAKWFMSLILGTEKL